MTTNELAARLGKYLNPITPIRSYTTVLNRAEISTLLQLAAMSDDDLETLFTTTYHKMPDHMVNLIDLADALVDA